MNYLIRKRMKEDCVSIAHIVTVTWNETYKEIVKNDFLNSLYGTEALKTVMKYLFEEWNMYLIEAIHEDINIGSGKVMEKAGMKKETVLKDRILDEVTQEFQDYIVYFLTENEYKSIK